MSRIIYLPSIYHSRQAKNTASNHPKSPIPRKTDPKITTHSESLVPLVVTPLRLRPRHNPCPKKRPDHPFRTTGEMTLCIEFPNSYSAGGAVEGRAFSRPRQDKASRHKRHRYFPSKIRMEIATYLYMGHTAQCTEIMKEL